MIFVGSIVKSQGDIVGLLAEAHEHISRRQNTKGAFTVLQFVYTIPVVSRASKLWLEGATAIPAQSGSKAVITRTGKDMIRYTSWPSYTGGEGWKY